MGGTIRTTLTGGLAVTVAAALLGCGGSKGASSVTTVTQVIKTVHAGAPAQLTEAQASEVFHAEKAVLTAASACLAGPVTPEEKAGATGAVNKLIDLYEQLGPDATFTELREPIVMRDELAKAAYDLRNCAPLQAEVQSLHAALGGG